VATNLTPNDYRTHVGFEVIQDIGDTPETTYYMFIGNHMPIAGNTVPLPNDDTNDTLVSAYRNMICGKIITANDAAMMIRNIPWVANTTYAMYDDQNTLQDTSNFYAIVNAGAFYHVWKVLDNNMDNPSTVPPDISQISVQDIAYRTGDGYLWKYMASTPLATYTKFATPAYFPVVANSQVSAAAVPGAIDTILVANTGSGYNNYLTGTFAAQDVRVNGNSVTYAVTGNNISSTANGFYTGCNIYISGGTGVGQYTTIIDYFSNANGNFIVLQAPFTTPPQNGSNYQIYPGVVITGQTQALASPAAARALVNAVGNTIYRIDMLSRGAGYSYISANITANAVSQPISPAQIRGIYAPFDGHGYNVYEELGATQISFSVTFANTEANTIPATNQYQQIGILKNPSFQNVVVNFASLTGSFLGQETIYTYKTRLLQNNVNISAGQGNVTATNSEFTKQLFVGDPVILNSSDNTAFWYTTIASITNDSFMAISSTPPWTCTTSQMSLAIIQPGTGTVSSLPGGNTVGISNVSGKFPTGTLTIGVNSGALGTINNVSRNDVIKDFTTYIALDKIKATAVSGSFQPNEIIFMGSTNVATATSTAALHSVTANAGTLTLYCSNTVGSFFTDPSLTIRGANSGAVCTLITKYSPEIAFGSSKVMYLENISAITRSNTTSDTLNIIMQF